MAGRLLLVGLFFSLTCPAAWAQNAAGPEFPVNSWTSYGQSHPQVTSAPNGDFVVVWRSRDQDAGWYGVFGQRFNASGVRRGSEFQVNSYTTDFQGDPDVASDANGNFIVVWQSYGQDGQGFGVFGQRFDAEGVRQGGEFRVNSYTPDFQYLPTVASDANGNFVVVWGSRYQDGSGGGIFGQRFNASGGPQGSEFRVNSYTPGWQSYPAVASDANGNFVVVWASQNQDGSEHGVFGQRFDAFGAPQGSEFQVNSYTTDNQRWPAVASDANGNFVVAWQSYAPGGSLDGVSGQRFNAAGVRQGSEFQVNSYTTDNQWRPAVASDANGNFVVAWQSRLQDGSYDGVFGQRFNASGVRLGGEFRVNSYTTNAQDKPAVASAANGDFVVVWRSYAQDGNNFGVFGQRYGDLIFKDGFE